MTSKEQCGDDRFEIINETKKYIINATNIDTSPEEMAVLDSICFRLWQLGLTKRNKDKLYKLNDKATPKKIIRIPYKDIYGNELLESKSHFYNGCPSCKDNVGIDAQYCRHCGQALDWSDVND